MTQDVDREAKTPRTTGSFAVFHDESRRIAVRFAEIAMFKEHGPLQARDRAGAAEAKAYAEELEKMAREFASWPELPEDVVALERPTKTARLLKLNRTCEEMAIKTPGMPAARR